MKNYFLLTENFIPIVIITLFLLVSGCLVLLLNRREKFSLLYLFSCILVSLWSIFSNIAVNSINLQFSIFITKYFQIPVILLSVITLLTFLYLFPRKIEIKILKYSFIISLVFCLLILILNFLSDKYIIFMSRKLVDGEFYGIDYPNSLGKILFVGCALTCLITMLEICFIKIYKFNGIERKVIIIILFGFIFTFGIAVFLAAILPALGNPHFSPLAYYTSITLVTSIGFSIINYNVLSFSFSAKLIHLIVLLFLLCYGVMTQLGFYKIRDNYFKYLEKMGSIILEEINKNKNIELVRWKKNVSELVDYQISYDVYKYTKGINKIVIDDNYFFTYQNLISNKSQFILIYFSPFEYRKLVHNYMLDSLKIVIIILIVLLTVAQFFWYSGIIKPLNKVLEAIKKLSKGDLDTQIEVTSNDEMGFLSKNINQMIRDLKKYTIELQEQERLRSEINSARKIQISLLPNSKSIMFPLNVVAINIPAEDVSGDFYDFIYNKDAFSIYIADVAGHALPASLFMLLTRSVIKVLSKIENSPSKILNVANRFIYEDSRDGIFVTMFYILFNLKDNIIKVANAGHFQQVILRKNGEIEVIHSNGIPLGVLENYEYNEKIFEFYSGDTLVLFTDGIFEVTNQSGDELGFENFVKILSKNNIFTLEVMVNNVINDVKKFIDQTEKNEDLKLSDDITMIVVRK